MPNLWDQLTCNYIREKEKKHYSMSGFHYCGQYKACTDSGTLKQKGNLKEFVSQDGKVTYKLKDFSTCNTENVIYLIQCPCGLRYTERTSRKIKTRIREHWRNITRIQLGVRSCQQLVEGGKPRHQIK